jgi:hypothetical protein
MRTSVVTKQKIDCIKTAIYDSNKNSLENLITEANVNSLIDIKKGLTPLHVAIKIGDESIIQYLLDMGASPNIKTSSGEDAIDLSIKYQSNTTIKFMIDCKNLTIKNLDESIINLEETNKKLKKTNDYLTDSLSKISFDRLKRLDQIDKLNIENDTLKSIISKDELTISSLRNDNEKLNGDFKSLKRKHSELEIEHQNLDKSFSVLIESTKKSKKC